MSELMNTRSDAQKFRRQLLTTVSALALLASIQTPSRARAADGEADSPPLWIELGGQLEQLTGQGENFPLAFVNANPGAPGLEPVSPLQTAKPPLFSYGAEAKISYEPDGTNWIFSAAVRYGRSGNNTHVHEQTFPKLPSTFTLHSHFPSAGDANYSDVLAKHESSHTVVDFQAGKDWGLGIKGTNDLNLGVRFAQFSFGANIDVRARPHIHTYTGAFIPLKYWRNYAFHGESERSFHGIGPSISWNASVPVAGNPDTMEAVLDWGVNGAVLFGRQKMTAQHRTTGYEVHLKYNPRTSTLYQRAASPERARFVAVPNIGAFAGLSFHRSIAKVSFGYRGDFFFGAIDGGIDTVRRTTTGFYGPFASVSVGLGG